MKKIVSIILVTIILISMSGITFAESFKGASDWAIVELERARSDGFITEKVLDDFSKNITREEFCEIAVILYDRLGGKQELEEYNPFSDTTNPKVIKAFNAGIINGVGGELFAPKDNLTREQLCVMILRAMKEAGIIFGDEKQYAFQKTYVDEESISSWASNPVMIMNDFKIMNGSGDRLEPQRSLSREQAVIMLERVYLREFEIENNILVGYLGNSSDVVIPSGVTMIEEDVFRENDFVKEVILPASVLEIGYASFNNMEELKSIRFNEGLKEIGEAAFEQCEQLEDVILPSTLETINFMAFQDCFEFSEITIPQSVNFIDDQGFYRCEKLVKVVFEGDVDYIGESAFEECPNVVFECGSGTNVERYAKEMGIKILYK